MRSVVSTFVVALLVALAACERGASDEAGVRAVAEGIVEADNARALERVLDFYAEDAVLLPPNADPVRGRAAIRPRYEALFAEYDPKIEARIDELEVDGDLAVVRGRNGGRLEPRGTAPARELDDAWLMVLRREGDRWRIRQLMWHPQHAP